MSNPVEDHRFEASVRWSGDASGSGDARVADGGFGVPVAGAVVLGGSGGKANPEELLMAAIGSCFANTWAIFIQKLGLDLPEPSLKVSGQLGPDPAGGFRMVRAVVRVRVPARLLAADRAKVEKTLSLAEKYCIISRVARAAMTVSIEVEET